MNIIFQISGGIGKVVAATAVCKSIKVKYPDSKLIVISGYPDVFINNPNVYRSFAFGQQQYFHEEYIANKEFKLFAHDPYLVTEHLTCEEHLIVTWCKIHDFKDDYTIVHIRREDQIQYEHTLTVTDNFRSLVVLISLSTKRLLMDSFAQHVAAALNLPSTVLWIVNNPKVFGYDIHTNIIANPETKKADLRASYLTKYNIGGDLIEFPYNNESEIFNIDEVINKLS